MNMLCGIVLLIERAYKSRAFIPEQLRERNKLKSAWMIEVKVQSTK